MKDIKTLKLMVYQMSVILDKRQKLKLFGVLIVILIGSLFELLGVSIILPFIQSLLDPDELIKNKYIRYIVELFNITDITEITIVVGIGVILVYLIKNLYLSFSAYLQALYSSNMQKELSTKMFRSYLDRPYEFFVYTNSGEVLRGVNSDIGGVYTVIVNTFKLISEMLVIALIAVYLVSIDVYMAIGVLAVGLLCMFTMVLGLKKKITAWSKNVMDTFSRKNRWMIEAVTGIKDVKVFNRRDFFVKKYDDESAKYAEINTKYTFVGNMPERLIEAFCVSGIIATVLFRFIMGMNTESFLTSIAVFAMGAFRVLPSIARITGYANGVIYGRPMVESTYNNITKARKYEEYKASRAIKMIDEEKVPFEKKIEVRDLCWKYNEGKKNVLSDFSLEINKGEMIGIIGESGTGKSTLADLLLGLYEAQSGNIYMDGYDIRSIPQTWSKVLSYVPQTVFLLDDTIRENIAFGSDNRDDDKIWDVLKEASLDDFVRSLPKGLDTIVGERGVRFSGGQRQRVAIARALYNDPQVLILDEATSALDNDTEKAVMEAIDALSGSMTLIVIAHRITTLKNCNKIYEIVDGRAVERDKKDLFQV